MKNDVIKENSTGMTVKVSAFKTGHDRTNMNGRGYEERRKGHV